MARFFSLSVFLLTTAFNLPSATAQENNTLKPPSTDFYLLGIILISIAILFALVLKLLKNNKKLNESIDTVEKDGKQWLDSNLKDLDAHQLEILIRRSNSKENAGAH
jgi:hypothetical protein